MGDTTIQHVGIIMDGNRRWAKARGLPSIEGHRAGYKNLKALLGTVKELGIQNVSVYAFSTENWKRTKEEVEGLMGLMRWVLKNELKEIMKEGLRIKFVGGVQNVPGDIARLMQDTEEQTKDLTEGTLAICFNYGGKQEIVDAVAAIQDTGEAVTVESITKNLYVPELPPADLIIRTSGEKRLSNFMLWRSEYAELHFTDTLWPDFKGTELTDILSAFHKRQRRFGA